MAVAANALTTLATVKAELGIASGTTTWDTVLERLINVASDAIEQYCERTFQKVSRAETLPRPGTCRLALKATPLVSITSVVDDGTTVDATTYAIQDAAAGILYFDTPWRYNDWPLSGSVVQDRLGGSGEHNIVVTYLGGYVLPNDGGTRTLPYDLEQVCIDTVVGLWRQRGRDRQVDPGAGDFATGGIIPPSALPTLNQYRRLV